jgi:DNA-binding SARP family transcriptional activator
MVSLRVILFGCPRVSRNPDGAEVKLTRIVQVLLAYLLLQRQRSHSREVLAGTLWSDNGQKSARACLNTALWRLRNSIEGYAHPDSPFLLMSQHGEVRFNSSSSYWLDVEVFENLLDHLPSRSPQGVDETQIQQAEQAVALYQGDLMEGYYEDWILRERERLRNRYLSSLAYLMSAHRLNRNLEASLEYGKKILQQEPLREEIHREMMRLYTQAGQRALAIQQYEICRAVLKDELDITPMPETERLFRAITQGSGNDLMNMAASLHDLSALAPYQGGFPAIYSEQVFESSQLKANAETSISAEMTAPLNQAFEQLNQAKQRLEVAIQDFHEAMQTLLNLFQ